MPANQQGPLLGASYMTWIHMRKSWNNKFVYHPPSSQESPFFKSCLGKFQKDLQMFLTFSLLGRQHFQGVLSSE